MKSHVVSLEIARRLKDAGYPQDLGGIKWSTFYNLSSPPDHHETLLNMLVINAEIEEMKERSFLKDLHFYAAPLATELLEQLPCSIYVQKRVRKWEYWNRIERLSHGWLIGYWCGDKCLCQLVCKTLPDAVAEMWLHLKKEHLL